MTSDLRALAAWTGDSRTGPPSILTMLYPIPSIEFLKLQKVLPTRSEIFRVIWQSWKRPLRRSGRKKNSRANIH